MTGAEGPAGWFALPAAPRAARAAFVQAIEPGQTVVLADVQESGCFRHLTCTAPPPNQRHLTLEAWWDDEPHPSVECPLPDFFGAGHGGHNAFAGDLRSLLLRIAPRFGYNSSFPMPFARRGLLRLRNDGPAPVAGVHFQADFHRYDVPVPTPLRFHAAWRRACPAYRRAAPLTLAEIEGSGYLAGIVYHVHKLDDDDRWTHGGGDLLFVDGLAAGETPPGAPRPAPHFIHGDGGEDFYGGAWGLYPHQGLYAGAHHAHPLPGLKDGRPSWEQHEDGRYSMYRWYVDFPFPFRRSLRAAFCTEANEISATTYWYQGEPHAPHPPLPPIAQREYGAPLAPDDGERPLRADEEWPLAVLGPFTAGGEHPWSPEHGARLAVTYESDLGQPYQDLVAPPWRVRWQATRTRHHFLDLQAIHRPKRRLTVRGLAGMQRLPVGTGSYVLAVARSSAAQRVVLDVGYEDRLEVWCNGRVVETTARPRPLDWATAALPIDLRAGRNELVFWLTNDRAENWSGWAAFFRLRGSEGGPVRGVEMEGFPDLPPTLERWREGRW